MLALGIAHPLLHLLRILSDLGLSGGANKPNSSWFCASGCRTRLAWQTLLRLGLLS